MKNIGAVFTLCISLLVTFSSPAQSATSLAPVIDLLLNDQGQPPVQPPPPPIELHPNAGKHFKNEKQVGDGSAPFGHYLYFPEDYTIDARKNFPLILFLHGLGEKGNGTTQLAKVLANGPPRMINVGKHIPAIVLSPQLSKGSWTTQNNELNVPADLHELVASVLQEHNVDHDRIYVTGLSLGGGGAWNYARLYASEVAAVVPICGVGINRTNMDALQGMGVWAFHAIGDDVVVAQTTQNSMNAVAGTIDGGNNGVMRNYPRDGKDSVVSRENDSWVWRTGRYDARGDLRYTVFPDGNHNSWSRAYNQNGEADTPMWQWLFSQSR